MHGNPLYRACEANRNREQGPQEYFSSVKDVALPVGPWEDAGSIIVAVECAASFRSLIRSGE